MDRLIDKLILRSEHWRKMLAHISGRATEESCGLIGGRDGTSLGVFPVTNVFHSLTRYLMDPEEQLKVFNQLEENQWELLAIYHSHLNGLPGPSSIDIAEAMYPGVIHLIWFRFKGNWDCRGFLIENKLVKQVPIIVMDDGKPSNQND
jgi:proteasome lid subunit RPN8/RPN11